MRNMAGNKINDEWIRDIYTNNMNDLELNQ
jgi:hypothetical protein